MRQGYIPRRATPLLIGLLVLVVLPGCETAQKKKIAVVPPAPNPEPLDRLPVPPSWPEPAVAEPKPAPEAIALTRMTAAYETGVQAYKSGHLSKAKTEFDRAVEVFLHSSSEVKSDPGLRHEFEKMVDNIHRYELAALREGDGFTERRPVLAPIDELADATFPADPRLKEKIEREVRETTSDLPLMINDYVLGYINYFSGRGKGTLINGWRRAGRYKDMILRIFKEEGVPQDLIYLAQAESSFQPLALSRAGARGMWQFMAFTGKEYGLRKNWWVDERQDPEKATRAAARHLRDLYQQYGDWYLAMAAYNSGPFSVQRAIERTGYADFWELYKRNQFPRETRNYVPIILAVTIMAKNPGHYGLTELPLDPPIDTETVKLTSPTDLRLIAETIDCSVELLQDLNPSLLRWVTPKDDEFELRLPAGTKERFLERIALIPEDKRVWWRWHRVVSGESLSSLAKVYKTTPASIAEVNSLAPSDELLIGAKLVIPVTPKNPSILDAAAGGRTRSVNLRYRVRKGDTLARVADRFGVSPEEVREWNRLRTNNLTAGKVLLIKAVQQVSKTPPKQPARKTAPKKSASAKPATTPARSLAAGVAVARR
jgi:membrane-bound lytic murein transglycosylase D